MRRFYKFSWFLVILGLSFGYESYKDYKVYEVTPTEEQHHVLTNMQYNEGIDFWRFYAPEVKSTIMVSPSKQKEFEIFLAESKTHYKVVINDVESILEEERTNMTRKRDGRSRDVKPNFKIYWSSKEMEQYCKFLADAFPQFVEMEILGHSPEGRSIYAMKISNGVFGQKPIIAMESGMHARASPPTTLYLMHRLVEDSDSSEELLEHVDWLIIPMDNPDGYEYTRSVDRLWRKNRRQISRKCFGVDLNRNFEFSWRAGNVPCGSQVYSGPKPLSEPESFQIHQIVSKYAENIKLYLSVHTFGDMVLWPWGYAGSPGWTDAWREHDVLGHRWRNGILAEGGRTYRVGNVADILGNAYGAVDDHVAGTFGIPYVYTLELTSGYQFVYPENKIEALAFESFWGYRAMALEIARQFASK